MTWSAREHESAIDYVLVNGRMREIVSRMWIDEEGMVDIVSDHNMLVVECLLQGRKEVKVASKSRKWRQRDVGWENFQIDLSERSWDDISVYDVEHLNEKLIENVRSAAENQIGYVSVGRRKRVDSRAEDNMFVLNEMIERKKRERESMGAMVE